jgi:pilus assembly protein CpaB
MNNTVLKILAALLAIGAIAVAIIGVRLSQQAPNAPLAPAAEAPTPQQERIIVAARFIKAGKMLGPADLVEKPIAAPPATAFRSKDGLQGKIAKSDIPAGTPMQPSQLLDDTMATQLRSGERAVAVAVDEVGGVGGYVRPGDRVDLLAFAGNVGGSVQAFAQIAVHNARVLSIGDLSQMDIDQTNKQRVEKQEKTDVPPGAKTGQEFRDFRQTLRSAVLAVPEAELTRVMLLSQAGGVMRLALRPVLGSSLDTQTASVDATGATVPGQPDSRQTLTLQALAPRLAKIDQEERKGLQIIIQEGSNERRLQGEEQRTPAGQP